MRYRIFSLILCLLAGSWLAAADDAAPAAKTTPAVEKPAPKKFTGTISAKNGFRITVLTDAKDAGADKTPQHFEMSADTKITINGKASDETHLALKMAVTVTYDDSGVLAVDVGTPKKKK